MKTLLRIPLLCFLLSPFLSASATDVPAPAEFADVRAFIERSVRDSLTPSVAVAVVRDDRIVWAEGFGLADIEAKRSATSDSIYLLASVSKPMTATGLMALVDRGKVELDKPANAYLRKSKLRAWRGSADTMTVRRLANHTSGMPVHWSFFYNGVKPPSRDATIERHGFSYNLPGSRWEYCNLAFGVLDHIVAIVGGPGYGPFMEKNVYDPLKMAHTSDRVRPGLESFATAQYAFDAGGRFVRVAPYVFDHDGASANWSSANDLARFLRMHLNDGQLDGVRVLSAKSAKTMRTLSAPRDPEQPDSGTGVAWFVGPYMGVPSFAHSGGMPGVSTRVRGFPEHGCGYVVLLNTTASGFRGEIEKRLTKVLIPEAKAAAPMKNSDRKPIENTWKPFRGAWTGRLVHYDGDLKARLEIAGPDLAMIAFNGRPPLTLKDLSFRSSRLTGTVRTRLNTQPSFHGLVDLEIRLEPDADGLSGIGVAQARDYFSLSHFVEFQREGDAAARPAAPAYDVVIRNGRIVDGSGAPWFRGDLAIHDGRIAKIGRLPDAKGKREIDAAGMIVCPGFFDMMGQTATPFLNDTAAGNNLLAQGVTTILAGEGGSAAPLSEVEGKKAGWRTMREYLDLLDRKGMPLNVAQDIGHTQVRRLVIGRTDRKSTDAELDEMRALVREAMEAGAIGVSTALIYPPAVYASTDEIAALARVAGEHGGRYYTHMRNEGDQLLEAIDEALEIGRKGSAPVHIFHLKAAGQANWGKMQLAIARIKAARAAGREVDADIYPYINNGLSLSSFIHPRHSAQGPQEFLRRIQDPAIRKEMRKEMEEGEGWENWFRHTGHDWDKVVLGQINTKAYQKHNGRSLGAIARDEGKDPWDFFWEILPNNAFALPQSMTEANKMMAMREEFVSFCTDVGPAGGSRIASHPRGYGSFPRILSKYVRDQGVISLEKAIAKMSSVAANQCLVHDRGKLAEGLAADVVVLDYETIRDRATFAEPDAQSEGVKHVFVNGRLVFTDGKHTGARPGRVLRGPGYVE